MAYTREQQKEAYQKLSPEVLDFIMSNETTELISDLLKKLGLSEEQETYADSEILYALLNLQSLSVAIDKIGEISNRDKNDLSDLEKKLNENIFSKIESGDYELPEKSDSNNESYLKEAKSSGVGQSFEQIILNQARAMRPAVGEGEQAPEPSDDEMIIEGGNEKNDLQVPNYSAGQDPYREPLQ